MPDDIYEEKLLSEKKRLEKEKSDLGGNRFIWAGFDLFAGFPGSSADMIHDMIHVECQLEEIEAQLQEYRELKNILKPGMAQKKADGSTPGKGFPPPRP